jgi:hypothetical protein
MSWRNHFHTAVRQAAGNGSLSLGGRSPDEVAEHLITIVIGLGFSVVLKRYRPPRKSVAELDAHLAPFRGRPRDP